MQNVDNAMQRLRFFRTDKVEPDHQLELASEDKLYGFESHIGHGLPPDYRGFLPKYGGVSLSDHVVISALDLRKDPDTDLFSVSDFFGFYSVGKTGQCS